jgi:hypothetical protein
MSVLGRTGPPDEPATVTSEKAQGAAGTRVRHSNGLKDFLWLIPEQTRGRVLDLGPVAQPTVTFFTDRAFRVSTEDIVRCWVEFRDERARGAGESGAPNPPEPLPLDMLASEFLKESLRFESGGFQGILAWDVFDSLETELLAPVVARLHELLVPSGVLLAAFHDMVGAEPCLYRVRDSETMELRPTYRPYPVRRALQNREILALFAKFRSSRTFIGRDHIREALFLK